ncbi:class I adenylate-forming enzyme family protein [Asticcacaulis sp.]|uniref:class I adenylate-forming enzyme family protein n=1 Tax=Asticcacaulis sp. TaxID=1872648 RepID=UPI002CBCC832|nr:AMP-binding protein [Asticcacaulis sp.]HTM81096.1 AMP-binding protein [Asticcacaulis sp.]
MTSGLWRRFDAVAAQRGNAPAIIQGDRHISFTELRVRSAEAAALMVRFGVQPGDRCLVWAGNSPDLAATLLGAWMIGAIVALVNDEAPVTHLGHAAGVTQPRVAFVDAKCAEIAERTLDCPVLVLGAETAAPMTPPSRGLTHDLEPASIFFTSGSMGPPKGVTQNHATLLAGCRMVAEHLGLRPDDRILCPIPWAFDYGYGQLLSTVLLGVTQVLPVARNPFALCEAIAVHRPTVFAGLPSIFALLLRGLSPLRETDLSSLRLVTNTGGLIPPAIYADVRQVFGHCDISLNYGMTETYRSAGLPVALAGDHPHSVGFGYPGVTLNVLRENGEEAEPDEIGEIIHRGAGAFMGYWGAPEATAKVLRPDPLWRYAGVPAPNVVFTGDLGWKTPEGLLVIKGRRDRQIKSMGVRVSPDEIETMIRATGLVRDVAIVGVPHEIMGEMIIAAVTAPADAPDPVPALKIFARKEMSQHMQPRGWHMMDSFPLTPNGKTDFIRLRKDLSQGTV